MPFISEIHYITDDALVEPEFVEIALPPGKDAANYVITFYDYAGVLDTDLLAGDVNSASPTTDILMSTGEISLASLVGTPDPESPSWTIYVIRGLNETLDTMSPVTLLDATDSPESNAASIVAMTDIRDGRVLEAYHVGVDLSGLTLTGGAADGATSRNLTTVSSGQSIQFDPFDINGAGSPFGASRTSGNALVVCFAAGTLIKTHEGDRRVEDLNAGDFVLTMDECYQPIRWIGSRKLDVIDLTAYPELKPICIRANALGEGVPKKDLRVSPQHRILVRSKIAQRMFGTDEVLIPAKKLLDIDGIDVDNHAEAVEYFHIFFDKHQIVLSNGAETESLFPGKQALQALSPQALREIEMLFPEIFEPDFQPVPAREIPRKGKLIQRMVERHNKNNKPVYMNWA